MLEIIEFLQKHWSIVMAVGGIVWTYFWLTMDSKYARKSDMADLRKAIDNNEKSLSEMKGELRHLPTSQDVSDLRILITEMKGKSDVLSTNIKTLNHQVALLIEKEVSKE